MCERVVWESKATALGLHALFYLRHRKLWIALGGVEIAKNISKLGKT